MSLNPNDIIRHKTADALIRGVRALLGGDGLTISDIEMAKYIATEHASKLGCAEEIAEIFEEQNSRMEEIRCRAILDEVLERNAHGNVRCSAANFISIYKHTPYYNGLRYNEFARMIEFTEPGCKKPRRWGDADEATFRGYAEQEFGIYSKSKSDDALASLLSDDERRYNPVQRMIEAIEWDGVDRISDCLTHVMGCEDTAYTRDVSRLIFAGGINRLYRPGCKFDDMPVLIGKQGCGKSTFVQWLALEPEYNLVLSSIEGKDALQNLQGKWIVEMAELTALTRKKEQEAIKAFISTQSDTFRPSYGKHAEDFPRTCIFIGTTNTDAFIADMTGGRRFYPIAVNSDGFKLHDHRAEHMEYIRQCWAEAYAKRHTDFMRPVISRGVVDAAREKQDAAVQDDYRVGKIQAWLDNSKSVDKICFGMIWKEILKEDVRSPTRADETAIGLIMSNKITGWERCNWQNNFQGYGKQRFWRRVRLAETDEKLPFED